MSPAIGLGIRWRCRWPEAREEDGVRVLQAFLSAPAAVGMDKVFVLPWG